MRKKKSSSKWFIHPPKNVAVKKKQKLRMKICMNSELFIWEWNRDSLLLLHGTKIPPRQPGSSENSFEVLHPTNDLIFDFESQKQLLSLNCGSLKVTNFIKWYNRLLNSNFFSPPANIYATLLFFELFWKAFVGYDMHVFFWPID